MSASRPPAPLLEGVRIETPDPRRANGLSAEAVRSLAERGQIGYRVVGAEPRHSTRRRTRLRSAKVLDPANAFLCDAVIQDKSSEGLRLLLARNVGLPPRFGVYDDETGEIATVAQAWRRGHTVGVRIVQRGPQTPLKPSEWKALAGRYYGVKG